MKKKSIHPKGAVCVLLALLLLFPAALAACGRSSDASSSEAASGSAAGSASAPDGKPVIEKNQSDSKDGYPYVVHTPSATWYFAADDIVLLGKDAFYEGFYALLELQEQDFADARAALKDYLPQEVPPVDIYTYFRANGKITELTDALYQDQDNYIVLFVGWENAGSALLHEYVHYLTEHCMDRPATHGFYAEGIAEYVSKLVCKNRMARRVNLAQSEDQVALMKSHGAWDEAEDCLDLQKAYFGQAEFIAQGGVIGTEVYTVQNTTELRTAELQQNPTVDNMTHFEAACILAYLIETDSMDKVMQSLRTDPEQMEAVFGRTFPEIYRSWAVWNTTKCAELGMQGDAPSQDPAEPQEDPVSAAFLSVLEKSEDGAALDRLSEPERVLYLVRTLEDEVNNGGFAQYFFNSAGDHANEAPDAFLAIRAPGIAELCRKANSVFGEQVPTDWAQREEQFNALPDDPAEALLSECDDAFFSSDEDLYALESAYIAANAASFGN